MVPDAGNERHPRQVLFLAALAVVLLAAGCNLRTGWHANEPELHPANVNAQSFGQLFDAPVTGQIYAQPVIHDGTVVAATEANFVYGLDAVSGVEKWQRQLGASFPADTVNCADLAPEIGITSTPVVDEGTGTVYLVSKTHSGDPTDAHWLMHALDLSTGATLPGWPVEIAGSADNQPTASFDPMAQHQRPGLLLLDGVVYAAFGAHCDYSPYRGWVAGVDAASAQMEALWTTGADPAEANPKAGIWMSGGGLMYADGRIIFSTGNGPAPPPAGPGTSPPANLSESVVALKVQAGGSLEAVDFFSPHDADDFDQNFMDLGSGAPTALTYGTADEKNLMVQIGKSGHLFILDRTDLGGRAQGPGGTDDIVGRLGPFDGVWGHPAMFHGDEGWLYVVGIGQLRALKFGTDTSGAPTFTQEGLSADSFGFGSGSPVVTSTGTDPDSALVWVVHNPDGSGVGAELRAYDAIPQNFEMNLRWSAPIGQASKFTKLGIDDGRVYVGTRDGHLLGFGSTTTPPVAGGPVDVGVVEVGGSGQALATLTALRDTQLTGASVTGTGFSVDATSLPVSLLAGEDHDLPVTFSPTAVGSVSGELTVTSDGDPVHIQLSGRGAVPGPSLSVDTNVAAFRPVVAGGASTEQVVLTNDGSAPLTFSAPALPGPPFSAVGAPTNGTVLQPGGSIAVDVHFAPTIPGPFADTITIPSGGGTEQIALSGDGVSSAGLLTLSPTSIDFGDVDIGQTASAFFDLANTGETDIILQISKAPTGEFGSVSPVTEGTTLLPGETLTQEVTFTPTATGSAAGDFRFTADDGQGLQAVSLSGNGTGTPTVIPDPTAGGWTVNGSAAIAGGLELTDAVASQTGSGFWPQATSSDGLDVSFDATISGGTGADGLTLALLDASVESPSSLGTGGGGLGFVGLTGVAVALDTWQNGVDPASNFVGLADGGSGDQLNWAASSTAIPDLQDATVAVRVVVESGRVQVWVDGTQVIDSAMAVPANVLVGFTGSTGGATNRHLVNNLSVTRTSSEPAPLLSLPSEIDLGVVDLGSTASSPLTIANAGTTDLTITAVTPPEAPFTDTTPVTSGTVLSPGASVLQTIDFTPVSTGVITGTYTIESDDGTGSRVVTLRGIGRDPAAVGDISTLAGTTIGFSGDGGPATAAQLNRPTHIATDTTGNVYFAELLNHRVRRIDAASGMISTVAGSSAGFGGDGGPAADALLDRPTGITIDAADNILVTDYGNNRIRRIAAGTGIITTVAGTSHGLSGDGGPATAAQLRNPEGVAVDVAGNLFIGDTGNHRVRRVDMATGIITTVAGSTAGLSGDGGQATSAQLQGPTGVAIDASGNLFVADTGNHQVRRVDSVTGIITTVAGTTVGLSGDNGPAAAAQLYRPQGLAFDASGNLYIADNFNHRVRRVDTTGVITTVAGTTEGLSGDGGPAAAAQLRNPEGVTFDIAGRLLIADKINHRIRVVDL